MENPFPFHTLVNIETTNQLPADFKRLGRLSDVYSAYVNQKHVIDIWENAQGVRIALFDLGAGECAYLSEGSLQGVSDYLRNGFSEETPKKHFATTGQEIIYVSKSKQITPNNPFGIGAVYTVHGLTLNGVLVAINNQTHMICHGDYVVV